MIRKALFAAVASSLLVSGVSVGPAQASVSMANNQFTSCEKLNKKFTNGIAKSRSAADFAVVLGYLRPKVSSALFNLNRRFDAEKDGFVCPVLATSDDDLYATPQEGVVASQISTPPQVSNLTLVANTPVRGDGQATFSIGWQIPSAASFNSFEVALQDGSRKTVNRSDGVAVTPDILGFSAKGFGPFGATVTVTVTAYNLALAGPPSVASLALPAAPKSTYTVEISAGSGSCRDAIGTSRCFVSITNATGGNDVYDDLGTWSYEAPKGRRISAFVRALYPNPSICTIKIEGVVVATQTSNGSTAYCYATV